METISCKHCGGSEYVKNGMVCGRQRYRCKGCGCNFTNTPRRGKPAGMKALAVLLYAMGNASFCMIARLLGVSDVAVLKWIRAEAKALPEPPVSGDLLVPTLDEMWHFIQKNHKNCGSGEPMILSVGEPWPGFEGIVMMQPPNVSSIKSAWKAKRSSPPIGKGITA